MSGTPDPKEERQQRARWDLLLLNIEHRTEQVRLKRPTENRRRVIQAVTIAAVFVAGVGVGGLLMWLFSGHG